MRSAFLGERGKPGQGLVEGRQFKRSTVGHSMMLSRFTEATACPQACGAVDEECALNTFTVILPEGTYAPTPAGAARTYAPSG